MLQAVNEWFRLEDFGFKHFRVLGTVGILNGNPRNNVFELPAYSVKSSSRSCVEGLYSPPN